MSKVQSHAKKMVDHTFMWTTIGSFLVFVGNFLIGSQSESVIVALGPVCMIWGLSVLIINGARCALYTNQFEREKREASLEEAENLEEI